MHICWCDQHRYAYIHRAHFHGKKINPLFRMSAKSSLSQRKTLRVSFHDHSDVMHMHIFSSSLALFYQLPSQTKIKYMHRDDSYENTQLTNVYLLLYIGRHGMASNKYTTTEENKKTAENSNGCTFSLSFWIPDATICMWMNTTQFDRNECWSLFRQK